jgi:hypothetical protein
MPQEILGVGAKPQHPSINPQILRKSLYFGLLSRIRG